MKFISGRNPDLFIYSDEGELIEKIDLAPLSTKQIHDILIEKGFKIKSEKSNEL